MHAHIARRHRESAHLAGPASRSAVPASRPVHVEAVPVTEATPAASVAHAADAEFARELEEIRERLRNTESQLVEERNSRYELLRKVAKSFVLMLLPHCVFLFYSMFLVDGSAFTTCEVVLVLECWSNFA